MKEKNDKEFFVKVAIVCINYNSYDVLNRYLDSIERAYVMQKDNLLLKVVVVDNTEVPQSITDKYSFCFEQVITRINEGYFGGFSFGISQISGEMYEYDYVIVSNVDLQMDGNFFRELIKCKLSDEIGCIAPSICSLSENKDRNPKIISRISLKKLKILRLFYKHPIINTVYEKTVYKMRRNKVQEFTGTDIYAAHGSFMMFTKQSFDFLLKLKYPVFLFGEEIYVAENMLRMKLRTVYNPNLIIMDFDHVSTGKMKSRQYFRYNLEATEMLIKEFFYD